MKKRHAICRCTLWVRVQRTFWGIEKMKDITPVWWEDIWWAVSWNSGNFAEFRGTFSSLLILYQIPLYSLWYTHDKALTQKIQTATITLPACSHTTTACRAEVEVWFPQPHGAAGPAQCPFATLLHVMFKNQSPSKLQLCLLHVASRSRKGHSMVKNQGWRKRYWWY